jgi:hypothetical protein
LNGLCAAMIEEFDEGATALAPAHEHEKQK